MQLERTVEERFETLWRAPEPPFQKARAFLILAKRLRRLADSFANRSVYAHQHGDVEPMRKWQASAAKILHLAIKAREHARQALSGKSSKMGFGYAPEKYATPVWSS